MLRIPFLPHLSLSFLRLVGVFALSVAVTSCSGVYYGTQFPMRGQTQYIEGMGAPPAQAGGRQQGPPPDNVSWWRDQGGNGAPGITISLSRQLAYFYKGTKLVGVSAISSGDENHRTPTGKYSVQQKDANHASSQYGDYVDSAGNVLASNIDRKKDPMPPGGRFDGARMPFFMRFTNGIGMHAGYLPGYPASHGCVRMPKNMAQIFFQNVQVGTPIDVRN
jgi:L,D-transpeptidase catalytic domain